MSAKSTRRQHVTMEELLITCNPVLLMMEALVQLVAHRAAEWWIEEMRHRKIYIVTFIPSS